MTRWADGRLEFTPFEQSRATKEPRKPVPQKWPSGRDEKREEPRLTSILIQKLAIKEPETEFRRKTAQRSKGSLLCHSRPCPQTGRRRASLLLENETRYEDGTWLEGREPLGSAALPRFVFFSFSSTLTKRFVHIHFLSSLCGRGCRLASHVSILSWDGALFSESLGEL